VSRYIIVGDTDQYEDCLVCAIHGGRDHAEDVLERMLNNPTENDKKLMEGHKNLRVKETVQKNCWWDN
jgi:hypothetical protein